MSSTAVIALFLSLAALTGHFALCVFLINRLHSTGLPRSVLKLLDGVWYLFLFGMPVVAWLLLRRHDDLVSFSFSQYFNRESRLVESLVAGYFSVCIALAVGSLIHRAAYLLGPARGFNAAITNDRSISIRGAAGRNPAGKMISYLATCLPLNEVLRLNINDKTLSIPRLDPALEGITMTHLSDLHVTGQWDRDFYRVVIDEALQLQSDVVMITGDIIENHRCLPWIQAIFSRLTAPLGVYFVLGNHEQRIPDELAIRQGLHEAGLIDLGSKWLQQSWRDRPVLLAGNELPWYPPAADLRNAPITEPALRIALCHAPDQLPWARRHQIDLLLAGHTHGGQVRIPGLGPLLCPSRYGIKYASGVFVESPTIMHVSRGIAGTRPLRYCCPPEITRITLAGRS